MTTKFRCDSCIIQSLISFSFTGGVIHIQIYSELARVIHSSKWTFKYGALFFHVISPKSSKNFNNQLLISMNQALSTSCSCRDCSCNPCLCDSSARSFIQAAYPCVKCGESCACVNCDCSSGETLISMNISQGHCATNCSCIKCKCSSVKVHGNSGSKLICKCH